jgi:heme exporter protein A
MPNNLNPISYEYNRLHRLTGAELAVSRGGLRLAEDITFNLHTGDALLIEGANGVGKTTLIKAIAGLGALSAGTLTFEGLGDTPPSEALHYVGHENALRSLMSVLETAQFFKDFYQGTGDVKTVLGQLGLHGLQEVPAGLLSAGQKRKLSLSRLILCPRPLWLLDEPLNALDSAAVQMVHDLIAEHRAKGGMVIAISHGGLSMIDAKHLRLEHGEKLQ